MPEDAFTPEPSADDGLNGAGPVAEEGAPLVGCDTFTIGELAREFDTTARAIRFYESRGLLTPERRGTARIYSRRDRARLLLILRGRRLGFSLEEIAEYLSLYDAYPDKTVQIRHLLMKVNATVTDLKARREDIDRTLEELDDIEKRCREALNRCE